MWASATVRHRIATRSPCSRPNSVGRTALDGPTMTIRGSFTRIAEPSDRWMRKPLKGWSFRRLIRSLTRMPFEFYTAGAAMRPGLTCPPPLVASAGFANPGNKQTNQENSHGQEDRCRRGREGQAGVDAGG